MEYKPESSKDLLKRLVGTLPAAMPENDEGPPSQFPAVHVTGDIHQIAFTMNGPITFAAPAPKQQRRS